MTTDPPPPLPSPPPSPHRTKPHHLKMPITFPILPLPVAGSTRARWYTPRINLLATTCHINNQWQFWTAYHESERPWEADLPPELRWRKNQLVVGILDVLGKLKTPPQSQRHLYELAVLQRGWDSVMDAIYEFFSTGNTEPVSADDRQVAQYIAAYAVVDAVVLEELHNDDSIRGHGYVWGMDPRRPDLAVARERVEGEEGGEREEGGQMGQMGKLGPIFTDMDDDDVPVYRCEVKGCRGGWWFESALKTHQEEEPHRMVRKWGIDDMEEEEEEEEDEEEEEEE